MMDFIGSLLFFVPCYFLVEYWDRQRKEELSRRKSALDEHERLISE